MKKFVLFLSCVMSVSVSARTIENIPYGQNNEYVAKWLPVPHIYEFNNTENPKGYYWCGQAAINTVMKYSGVTPRYDGKTNLRAIHAWLLKNKSGSYSEAFYRIPENRAICPKKYCTTVSELHDASKSLGMPKTVKRAVRLDSQSVYNQVKSAIDLRRPLIAPTSYNFNDPNSVGHFWVIAGYVDKGNAENTVLLLEDVASPTGRSRWDKKVLIKDFVKNVKAYRKKHGWSQSSFNMLILKN